jgi:hypothetical protein
VRYSEPEGTGEDVAIAYFRVLYRHLPAGNEENQGKLLSIVWLNQDANWEPCKYILE